MGIGVATAVLQMAGMTPTPMLWAGAAIASNAPDLDWLGVAAGLPWHRAHRTATHSLLTQALAISIGLWIWGTLPNGVSWELGVPWSLALLSHSLVDAITTSARDAAAGSGIPLLWPLASWRWTVHPPLISSPNFFKIRSIRSFIVAMLREVLFLGPVLLGCGLLGYVLHFFGMPQAIRSSSEWALRLFRQ